MQKLLCLCIYHIFFFESNCTAALPLPWFIWFSKAVLQNLGFHQGLCKKIGSNSRLGWAAECHQWWAGSLALCQSLGDSRRSAKEVIWKGSITLGSLKNIYLGCKHPYGLVWSIQNCLPTSKRPACSFACSCHSAICSSFMSQALPHWSGVYILPRFVKSHTHCEGPVPINTSISNGLL